MKKTLFVLMIAMTLTLSGDRGKHYEQTNTTSTDSYR